MAEGFWRREPSPGYLAALGGASADELPPGSPRSRRARRPRAGRSSPPRSPPTRRGRRYEETLIANGEAALAREDDPGLREWVEAARARWEHPDGKDTLGFALLTLRRAG